MINIPDNYLGADLFWWQEREDLHTLITIYWGYGIEQENVRLNFILFDQHGDSQLEWQQTLGDSSFVIIDSRTISQQHLTNNVDEGVLAVFITPKHTASETLKANYTRLYSIVDWYSEGGELCTLHNDQSLVPRSTKIEFTEIVFRETDTAKNFLVILNGFKKQKPKSVKLEIKNHRGETCTATYDPGMKPFTVHKLYMNQLFPDVLDFCDGEFVTLRGEFDAVGVYTRPYMMTQGRYLSGYHGGDRYYDGYYGVDWYDLPAVMYDFLGEGETNPVMAIHRRDITTTVNLLNSHGDLEDDFWVDARLYDEDGQMVAKRQRWLLARRNGLSRGDIKDLLPHDTAGFTGHIVLNFSKDDKPMYPARLQALTEYSTPVNTSRVMVWSDCWNSPERIVKKKKNKIVYQGYFRVWYHPLIRSCISITNSGIGEDYSQKAACKIKLVNCSGDERVHEANILPQGTLFFSLETFFEDVATFLGSSCVALLLIESQEDLAKVQITHHQKSGVYSAEHFMAGTSYHDGKRYWPTGS